MRSASEELYGFEGYTLDLTRGCLRSASGEIELRPKSFELLRYLIENAGRLISKDELVSAVWPNVIVGDDSLAQCVSDLRHALNDADRRIIKTVPRRGYLFAAPVTAPPRSAAVGQTFAGFSDRADQEYFAEGARAPGSGLSSQLNHTTAIRRLTAILAADVVGYSRLIGVDEGGTLQALKAIRAELFDPAIAAHNGRIVKTTGDGLLVEFSSVVDALRCATLLQERMAAHNEGLPADKRIEFRIGIHQGDVVVEDGDLFGDGVNVAVRLEGLAEPGGICVSARIQEDAAGKLDLIFEDLGERQLKNISRPVRIYRVLASGAESPKVANDTERPSWKPALSLPDKPSLAVLPFENMTGDPDQDYFVDGTVEEIITAISRIPWLFVIARNSTFTYKRRAIDVRKVARELGVRYLLEGSVRKAGPRVRITGQLIDTTTTAHIWADRFDGTMDDIFALQDQAASNVVSAIEPRLRLSEIERAARKHTNNLDAYDLYLRGLAQFHRYSEEGMRAAVSLLGQALAEDPSYAPAAAMFGLCRSLQRGLSWESLSDAEIAEAVRLTRQALEGYKDDPDTLWMAGDAISILAHDHATAAEAVDRALQLNANSAGAWMARGWVACCQNQPPTAIEALEHAMRLSPLDPLGFFYKGGLALAHLAAGHYQEAAEWSERCAREYPRYRTALRIRIVSCAHLGWIEEARSGIVRLLKLDPRSTIARFIAGVTGYYPPELVTLFVQGYRKAGLPEN
jgi:adenylate cyclase